ncbi:MAG: hypothetical protein EKK55_07755 [Rhodocyclaceae bacterium]|nr:MAG: hypothetical protein EKK55_07755 [Rhodocyclaceae bacterium]
MTTQTVETRKVPQQAFQIRSHWRLLAAEGEGSKRRRFAMVVHTGQPVQTWWGRLGVELSGVEFEQQIPALLDHDTQQRVGYTTKVGLSEEGLVAEGVLLSNDAARTVIADADEGYPWQASCYLEGTQIEEVRAGVETEINGTKVAGPIVVFRKSTMREVTFTALGADGKTRAEALAAGGELSVQIHRKEADMTTETKPATPATAEPTAAELRAAGAVAEKERVRAILAAADTTQIALAQELIDKDVSLQDAVLRLNADLKEKLSAARNGLRQQADPAAAGNGAGKDGTGGADKGVELAAMPEGLAKWKEQWSRDASLRAEFTLHGESEEEGQKRWLAFCRRNPTA